MAQFRTGSMLAGLAALAVASVSAVAQPAVPAPPVVAPAAEAAPGQRPAIGPAPDWVLPATVPPAAPAAEEAGFALLLLDQQARLSDGGEARYVRSAGRLGSAQALPAATASVQWDPALETLTIHHYRLLRDGKAIDLLGNGSRMTVVRREPNLEQAALDGRLTATFQPEDVRVGDIVEFAYTHSRRDPAFAGRIETAAGLVPGVPIGRARIRLLYPDGANVRHRAAPGFPPVSIARAVQERELLADVTNFTPPRPPRGAPARFSFTNAVEVTNADDWSVIADTGAKLFADASVIAPGSPLAAEVERIRAASPDPKARATLALKLVQEQVRYLFLGMDGGGYTPQPAALTWTRRFGDCKAKTALLLALLAALDIEARAALVHTQAGDGIDSRLPRLGAFDHVIVEARIDGKVYWLDGTRPGDRELDQLRPPPFRWALPLEAGAKLAAIPVVPLERPNVRRTLDLDARAGLRVPAIATGESRLEGDEAMAFRIALRQLPAADRERVLREFWREAYHFVTPETVQTADDPATGAFSLTMRGTAVMDWTNGRYDADGAVIGFRLDVTRDEELAKDAPFAVGHPAWTEYRQTILLPGGGKGFTVVGTDVDRTLGAFRFQREAKLAGERFTLVSSVRTLAAEMPAAVARAESPAFAELATSTVKIRSPANYVPSAAELDRLKSEKPQTVDALVQRARQWLRAKEDAAARADLEAALKLDPTSTRARGLLAFVVSRQDPPAGLVIAKETLARNPKDVNALFVRAANAFKEMRYADAERDLNLAIAEDPDWEGPRVTRAAVLGALNKHEQALVDVDAALAINPRNADAIKMRAWLFAAKGDPQALAVLDEALALAPDDPSVRAMRARTRLHAGDKVGARADFDQLLATKPDAQRYLERAQTWGPAERSQWNADLDAAQRLAPKDTAVWKARAVMEARAGDLAAAERALAEAERLDPNDSQNATIRADIQRRAGKKPDPSAELALLERAVSNQTATANQLNSLCWLRATMNIALENALANCEAALRLEPGHPAYLDSRGYVRLRLKQYEAAIADFDAVLKVEPRQSASLYGRGLARTAKGDHAGAGEDFAAARKISPDIDAEYAGYGTPAPDADAYRRAGAAALSGKSSPKTR